jgi:hypothetical protein
MTVTGNIRLALLALAGSLVLGAAPAGAQEASQLQQQSPQFFLPTAKKQKAPKVLVPAGSTECAQPCPDKEHLQLAAWVGEHKFAAEAPAAPAAKGEQPKVGLKSSKAAREAAGRTLGRWRALKRAVAKDLAAVTPELNRAGAFSELALDQWKTATLTTGPLGAGPVWSPQDLAGFPVDGVWSVVLDLAKGQALDLQVKRAVPVHGSVAADPLALAFEVVASGEPEQLRLLARADDQGDDPLPRLRLQAPRNLKVRLVVAAQRPGASGKGSLVVLVAGKKVLEATDAIFGGARIGDLSVGSGDRFLASAGAPGGTAAAADPVLLVLADEAVAGAPALLSNNAAGLNPEVLVPDGFEPFATWKGLSDRVRCVGEQLALGTAWTQACQTRPLGCFTCFPQEGRGMVLLASFGAGPLDAPLLVQSRAAAQDEDEDLLDAGVERILGTCDGAACRPKGLPKNSWTADDTDLDGISDMDELFGVRRCFPRRPLAPDFDPGPCLDRDMDKACDRDCQPGDFMVQQALGAALDANPLVYDLFVEADGWAVKDAADQGKVLLPAQQRVEEMGKLFAALRGPLPIRLHWFNDGTIPIQNFAALPHLPSAAHRHAWSNLLFTPERRHSGVFRYVLGVRGTGAQSDVAGRAAIIGMDGGDNLVFRVVHELGHALGISHNYDRKSPDRNPFYTSIMNYGFVYSLPPAGTLEAVPVQCSPGGPPAPPACAACPCRANATACPPAGI